MERRVFIFCGWLLCPEIGLFQIYGNVLLFEEETTRVARTENNVIRENSGEDIKLNTHFCVSTFINK